jgi:hypothetical protein
LASLEGFVIQVMLEEDEGILVEDANKDEMVPLLMTLFIDAELVLISLMNFLL